MLIAIGLTAVHLVLASSAASGEPLVPSPRAVQRASAEPVTQENHLVTALLKEFRSRNPDIVTGAVIELRQAAGGQYVVLAWGGTSRPFRGRFDDELFGIFLVDPGLGRVERVLEILPTPRWGDYNLRIASMTQFRLVVTGEGSSYGDNALKRVFDLGDTPDPRRVAAAAGVRRLAPPAFPQLPRVVHAQLQAEGCTIPQDPSRRAPHNVVSGQFAAIGQVDWAVLCLIEGMTSIRVFWGGYASCRGTVGEWEIPDWAMLVDGKWNVVLEPMRPRQVAAAAREAGAELVAPLHDGLMEMYCQDGRWLNLHVIP